MKSILIGLTLLGIVSCGVQVIDKTDLMSSGKFEGNYFKFDGTRIGGSQNQSLLWKWLFEINAGGSSETCETIPGTASGQVQLANPGECINYSITGTNENPIITPLVSPAGEVVIDYTLSLINSEGQTEATSSGSVNGTFSAGAVASVTCPKYLKAGIKMALIDTNYMQDGSGYEHTLIEFDFTSLSESVGLDSINSYSWEVVSTGFGDGYNGTTFPLSGSGTSLTLDVRNNDEAWLTLTVGNGAQQAQARVLISGGDLFSNPVEDFMVTQHDFAFECSGLNVSFEGDSSLPFRVSTSSPWDMNYDQWSLDLDQDGTNDINSASTSISSSVGSVGEYKFRYNGGYSAYPDQTFGFAETVIIFE